MSATRRLRAVPSESISIWGGFAGCVVVEAAPRVVLGFGNEAASDGVSVDVLDFLYELGCGEDIEVVVARLPEVVTGALEKFGRLAFEDSDG